MDIRQFSVSSLPHLQRDTWQCVEMFLVAATRKVLLLEVTDTGKKIYNAQDSPQPLTKNSEKDDKG